MPVITVKKDQDPGKRSQEPARPHCFSSRKRALKGERGIFRGAFLGDSVGAPIAAPRSLPAGDRAKGLSADPAVLNLQQQQQSCSVSVIHVNRR